MSENSNTAQREKEPDDRQKKGAVWRVSKCFKYISRRIAHDFDVKATSLPPLQKSDKGIH